MNNENFIVNATLIGNILINSFIFNILVSRDNLTFQQYIQQIENSKHYIIKKKYLFFNKITKNKFRFKYDNKYNLLFFVGFYSDLKNISYISTYNITDKEFYINYLLIRLLKEITIIYSVENNNVYGVVHFFNWFFKLDSTEQLFLLRYAINTIEIDNNLVLCIQKLLPYQNEVFKISVSKSKIIKKDIDNFTYKLLSLFFNINSMQPLFTDLSTLDNGALNLKIFVEDLHKFNNPSLFLEHIVNKIKETDVINETINKKG